jgi:MSHA biogenesis protein MshN
MLQDLDARGSQSGASLPGEIKPVLAAEPRLPVRQIALGATVLVVAIALAAGWWIKKPAAGPRPLVVQTAPPVLPVDPVQRAPLAAEAAPPAAAAGKSRLDAAPAPAEADATVAVRRPAPAAVARASGAADQVQPALRTRSGAPATVRARAVLEEAERARIARNQATSAAPPEGRSMSDAQRAERLYRDAIAMLDQGRVAAAMDALGQTLKLDPRHDGARQSLVSLLIEAGRKDEAMQQLEQGLAADPGQAQLAMLLARMQIERGQSGVATLMRTLPSASGNADYHAFLAGALQRDARHAEAVEQYTAALRANPDNGVWLMGMGISLQADQRPAQAKASFERARDSRTLSAPLLEFVQRKLQQLAP